MATETDCAVPRSRYGPRHRRLLTKTNHVETTTSSPRQSLVYSTKASRLAWARFLVRDRRPERHFQYHSPCRSTVPPENKSQSARGPHLAREQTLPPLCRSTLCSICGRTWL
ncbi:uncharacterized protein PV06_01805 [Exophiala oligosperma]|uniref:Uncharacterized protein n=1 Tax=Exophiala oligosperma TaxID=215243 RepID=A0A0D2DUC8_9EURO|nr:uncharacterized protein PV06_01805 [Exophiala oligosperma]KIW46115.1 hypothetical protein PV06_01805 [Exophiala oligosperma]